jgi:uncharacterized protein involved in exopolysaccharide biosynthesis
MTLWEIYQSAKAEWRAIAGITAISSAALLATAFLLTPVYRAEAVVIEVDDDGPPGFAQQMVLGQLGGLAGLAGLDLRGLSSRRHTGSTLLQSRTFIETFITANDLMPVILYRHWDEANGIWKDRSFGAPTVSEAAREFTRRVLKISRDQQAGLVTVAVEWRDPEQAASWANELVRLANETARARDIAEAQRSVAYLREQINATNVIELHRVLYNLIEHEQKSLMLANAREEYVFQVVDPAIAPAIHSRPRRTLMAAAGVAGGAFLGLLFVLARRAVRNARSRTVLQ